MSFQINLCLDLGLLKTLDKLYGAIIFIIFFFTIYNKFPSNSVVFCLAVKLLQISVDYETND